MHFSTLTRRLFVMLVFALLGLAGCSTTRLIDSDVRSVSTFKSQPLAPYRFERTLSQQSPEQATNQAALEKMAEAAMTKVGLQRHDAKAGYSVLVSARVQREWRNVGDPWLGNVQFGVGFGGGRRGGWGSFGMGLPRQQTLHYTREVSLLMRDLGTQQVVYETTAVNDGLWGDDNNILPLLFEAAISGFPTPPPGVRRVNIDLPPKP